MPGTTQGGKAAAETNKRKYGDDFYGRIGAIGGKKGRTGGFWHSKYILKNDAHKIAGKKGGTISRRRPSRPTGFWATYGRKLR